MPCTISSLISYRYVVSGRRARTARFAGFLFHIHKGWYCAACLIVLRRRHVHGLFRRRRPVRPVLCCLERTIPYSPLCSSFDDASPFIADQSEAYTWHTELHPVDFGARWATFSSADVLVAPHLSSAGLCTVVRVIKGNVIVYIGDATPAYAKRNHRNLEGTAWQAVGLYEGDQMCVPWSFRSCVC